jgi:putative spermidine/putrescine transport system ATP-binding protein
VSAFLSIRGVSKRFQDSAAVNDVSLDIEKGEFVTFLGPSGSGKSTLLYLIAGLHEATQGDISLSGKSLLDTPPNKRNIGMVFQRYTLIPHMNVRDNITFPLKVRHWSRARIEKRLEEMLKLVRLEKFARRKPTELSGGQQQRVALARALAYDPEILLMDEPLAALDKRLKEDLQLEIRRIHRETGATIIYVTHDQEEALRLSDRIAVFNHGRIEQIAVGKSLYDNPANMFVAGFVGNSNFLRATLKSVEGDRATALMPDGTLIGNVRANQALKVGVEGALLARPEQFRIRPLGGNGGGAGFPATIRDATYLGETMQIAAVTAWGQELSIRCAPAEFKPGGQDPSRCRVTLSDEGPILFFANAERAGGGYPA